MRILHVVSLVDPEASFGGPLRVAENQARELRAHGHDVTVAAGVRGYERMPLQHGGVRLSGFPAHAVVPRTGFAGLAAPRMLSWLWRNAPSFDVVHVHLARDLVSLPGASLLARRGVPFVVQTHGMIDASSKPLAAVLDAALTRRTLREARVVLALTEAEAHDVREVAPGLRSVHVLPNGVPSASRTAAPELSQDVLFLARLAERKRPLAFVRMAQRLAREFEEATFSLVGPDEGCLDEVQEALRRDDADGRIRYEGVLEPTQTVERMARSGIYVLPAVEEPFGMTVIEAMSVALPVVVLEDCGLADAVRATGGEVTTEEGVAAAVSSLLSDPARRAEVGAAGRAYVGEHFAMDGVTRDLEGVYEKAVTSR